jgi:hypothetical protein
MARRYGQTPAQVLGVPDDLESPEEIQWFSLILSWACVRAADYALRSFIQQENSRGTMLFPVLPVTDWPR